MNNRIFKIRNWKDFQHYKDRTPPWIKLHYELITSKDWVKFDDASKLLAIVCMMLASRNNGEIEDDIEYIKTVAHLNKTPNLKPLIDSGFLILASEPLADASMVQADAIIEERREEERREDNFFTAFYDAYPKKVGKLNAEVAYKKAIKKVNHNILMAGLEKYKTYLAINKTESKYIKQPATWLNQGCWEDSYEQQTQKVAHWN
jgi:hypothetical protein